MAFDLSGISGSNEVKALPIEISPPTDVTIYLPHGKDSKWGRIVLKWEEETTEQGKVVLKTHTYAACINTTNGDIYLDCDQTKIWKKFSALTIIRPLHTISKTIYHLPIFSWPIEIASVIKNGYRKGESHKEITKKAFTVIGRNLAQLVLTPLCGLALTIISIASALFGPWNCQAQYYLRDWAGKIENFMCTFWGGQVDFKGFISCCPDKLASLKSVKKAVTPLAKCFIPISNIHTHEEAVRNGAFVSGLPFSSEKVIKEMGKNTKIRALNYFAYLQVDFMRNVKNPCNNCWKKMPKSQTYVSPVYKAMLASRIMEQSNCQMTITVK